MKKELLISKMAILLFFYVFLFGATAQAQQGLCFLYYNETDCTPVPGCHWCATSMTCIPLASDCPTCGELNNSACNRAFAVCHWCDNQYICFPKERPCTCGNKSVELPEQCDGGPYCTVNCTCPEGYENDGGNGCKPMVVPPVCGNYIYEPPTEECDGTRNCGTDCKCVPPAIPDSQNPGFCKAVAVCGNNILEEGEQCELFSKNCVDCVCVGGTIPDPINIGYCMKPPAVCGNGIFEEGEQCDGGPNCGNDCKCMAGSVPDSQGNCVVQSVCGNGILEQGEECDSTANCDTDCKCLEYYIPTSQGYCAVDVKVAVGDAVGEIPAFNVKSKGKFTVRFTGETAPVLNPSITMTTSDLYGKNTYVSPLYYQWDVNGDLVLQYSRQQMVQVLKLDQYTKKEVVQLVFGCWADANHFELIGMIKIVNK